MNDDTSIDDQSLIDFPCDFQIKIIGKHTESFVSDITNIARKHFPQLADASIRTQPSGQGNYIAISITVYAENKPSLDALYHELTKHPDSKMVL